ncbi:chromate transporter [Sodalis sp. RH21]|uniref:chromate transporter n=1 Tax=unclassified Sodalis (in: enterobacteria) TaxID=2636512 RepID=UPI0039B3D2D9
MQRRRTRHCHSLPRWVAVLVAFAKIGTTAFGGGSATIAAIRQACLRHGWMNADAFIETVVLSRLTPGISILAQAVLVGRVAAGVPGIFAALIGLLTPALAITLALAKLYETIGGLPATALPLHTIVATAAGYAIALTLQLMRDIFRGHRFAPTAAILIVYACLAFLIANPLIIMGIAITLALLFPAIFSDAAAPPPPGQPPRDDGEP